MDRETQKRLYETYYMKLFSFVMTLARDRNLAEEITQETFYRAITSDKTFRGESEELTWLSAIAKNLYFDEMRRRARNSGEIPEESASPDKGPDESFEESDTSLRIHVVLHNLEEPYKEVFSLRVFGELSFAAIGTVFGKTESWARVTYHRAKLKIQERMNDNEI